MNRFLRLAAVALPMILLAACGGGGGGGGTPSASGEPEAGMAAPLPEGFPALPEGFPVASRQLPRSLTGGTAAPDLAPQRIEAIETARMEAADTVLFSDVLWVLGEEGGLVQAPGCVGTRGSDIAITGPDGSTTTIPVDLLDDDREIDPNLRTVMVKNRVTLYGSVRSIDDLSAIGYGGWLDGSMFAMFGARVPEDHESGMTFGLSIGNDSGSNPAGTGSATWSGIMVGGVVDGESLSSCCPDIRVVAPAPLLIQGDATIDIDDLTAPDVDVLFSNLVNLTLADARREYSVQRQTLRSRFPVDYSRIDYEDAILKSVISWSDLPLTNGAFTGGAPDGSTRMDGSIEGRFYGVNHEEVGGVFQQGGFAGAFGATRQQP